NGTGASKAPGFGGAGMAFPGGVAQEFALEPAVDQLLRYEGYDFAHPTLAAPLRPIIAHEVNLEAMRQAEAAKQAQGSADTSTAAGPFADATAAAAATNGNPGGASRPSPFDFGKKKASSGENPATAT
ncbi:unnamed protein product, partial [Laminaria digitata]